MSFSLRHEARPPWSWLIFDVRPKKMQPHDNDISVGRDSWIESGEIPSSGAPAFEVDPVLKPVEAFVSAFETECVAGCCGICAYSFWPERVREVVATEFATRRDELLANLTAIKAVLASVQSDTVVSFRMNQYFRKDVFIRLVDHLVTHVQTA